MTNAKEHRCLLPERDDLRQKAIKAVKRGERKTDVSRMLNISRTAAQRAGLSSASWSRQAFATLTTLL